MRINNVSTLKINKLTQEQYDRELAAGRIDENAFYLTPDESQNFDDAELITTDDIDAICSANITMITEDGEVEF